MRHWPVIVVAILATMLAVLPGVSGGPAAAAGPAVKIAYTGDSSGIGTLLAFSPPDVNDSGVVAFKANTAGPCGLFAGTGGSPVLRAADGTMTPSGPVSLCPKLTQPPLITNGGPPYVAAEANVSGGDGIFLSPAPGTLTTVVVQGAAVPAPVGGTFGPPVMEDLEEGAAVLFLAPITGGCASQALYMVTGAVHSLIAKAGGACPDPAPGGGTFTSIIEAKSNSAGTVVFLATTSLGVTAIYKYMPGIVTRLVGAGDTWDLGVENVPLGMLGFSAVGEPRLNESGQVSFRGTLPLPYGDGYFLATGDPPEITKEALPIDPAPTGGAYTALSTGGPHDLGGEVRMLLSRQPDGRTAITQYDPFDVVVMEGDTAPGTGGAAYGAPVSASSSSSGDAGAFLTGTTGAPCGAPHCFGLWRVNPCWDLDRDKICDTWESGPLDINKDGDTDIDLSLAGNPGGKADTTRKDIFVEVDWMDCSVVGAEFIPCNSAPEHNHDPIDAAIDEVVSAFAIAPVYNAASCEDGVCSVPPATPACSDSIDNGGGDGIDQADPDCNGINLHVLQDEGIPHAMNIAWTYEDFSATCGDRAENGSVDGADANDPDCHTDGNIGNPNSFDDSRAEDGKKGSCNDGVDNSGLTNGVPNGHGDGRADTNDPDCHPLQGGDGYEDGNASCKDGVDNGLDGSWDVGDGDGGIEGHEDGECEVPDDFDDDKALYFGTAADRAEAGQDNIIARKTFYHYSVFANYQYGTSYSSGRAEIMGNDFVVTLGGYGNGVGSEAEQAATFMHELGHNLGLRHGGDENLNRKPNYLSVMNYLFQFVGSSWYVDSRPLDYSRWDLADLNEQHLNETNGVDNDNPPGSPFSSWKTAFTTYFPGTDTCDWREEVNAAGNIDWDNDGAADDADVAMGINGDYDAVSWSGTELCQQSSAQTTLHGYDDWGNLRLQFQNAGSWGDGAPHYPWTQDEPSTVGDADGDGANDLNDNCPSVTNPGQENVVHPLTPAGDACENPDGDAWVDAADNCPDAGTLWLVPPDDNPDCDGFPSTTQQGMRGPESFIGTDPNLACGVNAWPVDINNDHQARLSDILAYIPHFGYMPPAPQYNARFDLNADNKVGLQDILIYIPFFNLTCTP